MVPVSYGGTRPWKLRALLGWPDGLSVQSFYSTVTSETQKFFLLNISKFFPVPKTMTPKMKVRVSMPIYLYLKTHQVTGLKYLGKTKKDPYKYKGSGVEWKKHLRVYGNDVATEVIRECATDEELSKWGKYYSVIFDVVNSPEFLNRIPETGIGHGCLGNKHSEETKQKISEANKGKVRNKGNVPWNKGKKGLQVPWNKGKTGFLTHSEETKRKIGEASKVRNKGNVPWNKGKSYTLEGNVPWNKGKSYTLEGKRRRGKDKGKTRRKKLNA